MPEKSKPAPDRQVFDVFLSHNSKDKGAIRRLKERLIERGLTVWFDEEQLRPGIPWPRATGGRVLYDKYHEADRPCDRRSASASDWYHEADRAVERFLCADISRKRW